ncbi:hypothetical protein MZO42_07105 [Sphingomonas psychrotolerans]|uniref:LysM domain-containing protein n=1 Tax=Sphingomonas psychrotolerans TaxID=1327635 RepID=A0ABU3N1M3_9SPHN|nr:hypothetical protein [Sphingomonas psychrotolerans]MDT8758460.1 hypothetical protein [Sphingomonas psychrotolerans]
MSLETINRAFTPNAQQVTTLTAASLPAIAPLLASLAIDTLIFTQARVIVGATSVTLSGKVTWRGSSGNASIIGTVQAQTDRLVFDLDITTPLPWTLGVSFPAMPPMWRDDGVGIVQVPSVLPGLQVRLPSIRADNSGLPARLAGWLPLTGDLAPYASYVGPGDLGLDGVITFAQDGTAQLLLDALSDTAPGRAQNFDGTATSHIGLRLTTEMQDDLSTPLGTMSAILLLTRLNFRGEPIDIVCPLLWGDDVWPLYASLWKVKPKLSDGLLGLSQLFGLPPSSFALPPAIDFVNQFYLGELGMGLIPPPQGSSLPSVQYLRAAIASDHEWSPPIPYVRIGGVGATWAFYFWGKVQVPELTAQVWGEMRLGGSAGRAIRQPFETGPPGTMLVIPADSPTVDPVIFRVSAFYPSWVIEGALLTPAGSDEVPLTDIFAAFNFTGAPDTGLAVHHMRFRADPLNQRFRAEGAIAGEWALPPIGGVTFKLTELGAWIEASQSKVTGGVSAFFYLDIAGQGPVFTMAADYLSSGRWLFLGKMEGSLSLVDLLVKAFDVTPPEWVADMDVALTKLEMSLDTGDGTGGSYDALGAVVAKWRIAALGVDLAISAEASIRKTPALTVPDRKLVGAFTINKLVVTAGVDLSRGQQTYMFSVRWDTVELIATTANRKKEDNSTYQVLNLQLKGLTLGDILTYFVRLASPASEFSLEPPWDLLNKIDLASFVLTLDKVQSSVELNYSVEADFGFIYVKSVGIAYSWAGKGRVNLVLAGRILDQKYGYDGAPPLSWDVVDDPPPAVPGKGPRLLDLRYMGVGQHVTLKNMAQYRTLEQVITALRREMRPVDDPEQSPIGQAQVPELIFDEVSQWMLGFDFTVIDTLRVALVLHDPDLYGILISLSGPKAGSLAGFSFELLYRKVTDDIGVFRVQLKVPDMFRQLEFGAVSITLGVITVEVFTNGNFSVDLGFPHNRSFADSFAVQWFPFIGRGGIYFAVLTGATSRRVPAITNGNFDPVLELGVGLAVGLGKEVIKGPLKAGLYVEVEVIVEGVLAWFHPSDAAVSSDRYFWIQGMAGVTGKLYGAVDFKVIKVSVSVTLHAYAMVTIEAYKATVIDLEVGVEAEASIKILFVRINFSFSFTLHETFRIGSDSRPPWTLAGSQPGNSRIAFAGAVPSRRRGYQDVVLHTRDAYLGALHAARPGLRTAMAEDPYVLDWDASLKVFADQAIHPAVLRMVVLPAVDQVTVAFAPAQPADNPDPAYRVSIVLTADTGDDLDHSPEALLAAHPTARYATTALSAHAADVPDLSLNVLVEGFLRWALDALPDHPVTDETALAGQIDLLLEQMNDPRTADIGFATTNLSTFLGNNIALRICLPPSGSGASTLSGATFPMPPVVSWTATQADRDRDFATFNPVGPAYEQLLATYFAALDPLPPGETGQPVSVALDSTTESVASFVFRDAMLMLTKSAVEEAQTLMRAWPYVTLGGDSLNSVCEWFEQVDVQYLKHAGDTTDQVAAHFGLSRGELLYLNPDIQDRLDAAPVNTTISVTLGVTPMSVASANADTPLAAISALPLGDLVTQVAAAAIPNPPVTPPPVAETLAQLAQRFGKTAAQVAFGDTLLSTKLLRAGASLATGTLTFANPDGLTLDQAAALLYVRLFGLDGVPGEAYRIHAQLIAENNSALTGVDVTEILTVATVALSATAGDVWQVQVGDTLARIAGTVALLRDPAPQAYTDFLAAVEAANPGHVANPVAFPPAAATVVAADESIAALGLRLVQTDTAVTVGLIAAADILTPLAAVTVPAVSIAVSTDDTIGGLARAYGVAIEELGGRLAGQAPLFDGAPSLTVPNVPAVAIDKLIDTLQRSHASVRIAGMISNFLMHGLRPPAPGGDHAPAALHAIIGQEIAPDTAEPMVLTLAAASEQTWLAYFLTAVSLAETLPAFATRNGVPLAQVEALNPGAYARYGETEPMPAGLVLITAPAESAQTSVTEVETLTAFAARVGVPLAEVEALNPAVYEQYGADTEMPAGLVLVIAPATSAIVIDQAALAYPDAKVQLPTVRAPVAMPLARQVPVTYGLQQHIVWQAGINPWATGASNASPSLWPFPAGLSARAATPPTWPYSLVAAAIQSGATAPAAPSHYSWATRVDIAIRRTTVPRLDGSAGGDLANTYEVIGADTAGRQILLDLWQDLPATGGADLYLLYAPSQQSDRSTGLASAVLDPRQTFIVKVNLSTETAAGRAHALKAESEAAMPIQGADFAQIDAPKSFVTLLWECSVVGGGGFVLGYAATDGSALPDWLFSAQGTATITLLAIPKPQVSTLKPYFNCVAVGDNVDASTVSLAVTAGVAETVAQPVVAPGNVGFDFALSNPDLLAGQTSGQQLARQSYSLAAYALGDTPAFRASETALQVGPQVTDPQAQATGQRAVRDEATWYYHQVIPISRFAKAYIAAEQAQLPAPQLDPYAGIAACWTPEDPQPADTEVAIWFQDLIGNISSPGTNGVANIAPIVGYTDPLKAVGQWPNVAAGYQVAKHGDRARLSVGIGLQFNAYLPGPGDAPEAAVASAASHRATYQSIHFQLAQPDLRSTLTTNLAMTAGESGTLVPVELDGGLAQLRAMAAANYIFLDLLAGPAPDQPGLVQVTADIAASPTMDRILADYGFVPDSGETASGYELLARANALQPLSSMLWGAAPPSPATIAVPVFQIVIEGATFQRMFGSETATIAALSQIENAHLPLRSGQSLVIPHVTKTIAAAATSSLFEVARTLAISPTDLAMINADTTGILRAGFAFEYLGVTAMVGLVNGATVSLQTMAEAYTARGYPVNATDLAVLNQYSVGMFADAATVTVGAYIVQPTDTISDNGASLSVTDLVNGNFLAPNVFDTGVPIHTGTRSDVAVPPTQPLEQFASTQGITAVQLLQSLAATALAPAAQILIPGAARWAHATPLPAPYGLRSGDTLDGIAAAFGGAVTPETLAVANADLPGVLSAMPITLQEVTVTPVSGASFNSVVAQFAGQHITVSVTDIAGQIAGVAGHLYAGGLLVCPMSRLGTGSAGLSLAAIATSFGVSASDFAAANAAMPGLLLSGVPVTVDIHNPEGGTDLPVSTTTRRNDTFNSLAARFAAMGAPASVTTIAAANTSAALIDPAAVAVLPPAPVTLTGDFAPGAQGWRFAEPIFEIEVALTLERASELIDPGFRSRPGDPPTPVQRGRTVIAPASSLSSDQSAAIGSPIRLEQFAAELEAGIPALRVASGKVLVDAAPSNDLWAVVFGPGGIQTLTVAPTFDAGQPSGPTPWFFAIRPLSTDLISAPRLPLRGLVDGALSGTPTLTDISGVDIETWATAFLVDFDRMLSPAYAAGLYRLDSTLVRSRLDELIGNKATLAGGIAAGLDFVLASDTLDQKRRASAIAMLRQRLLASLALGYSVSVVMQWDATAIQSPWTGPTVKLTGAPAQQAGGAPNVSIGTTKITLAKTDSPAADPYVNATLTVTNAQQLGTLAFDAEFVPNEIEFDITPVSGVTGYASSNWLRFVNPLTSAPPPGYNVGLGTVVAPLPLRTYPALPQLLAQTTPAQDPATTDVATAAQWRYVVDVGHRAVVQDELGFNIEVNIRSGTQSLAASPREMLIAALAQYNYVASDLWQILEAIPAARSNQPADEILVAAIGTFIDLSGAIARAWAQLWGPSPAPTADAETEPPTGPVYASYDLSGHLAADQGVLQSVTLTGNGEAPGPGGWPELWIRFAGKLIQLDAQDPAGNTRLYKFPAGSRVPADAELVFELRFPGLASGNYHNARSSAAVVRNAHLMPNDGPATREPFVYRTPFLTFADEATPLVTNSNRLPIGSFTKTDYAALTQMFHDIFDGPGTGLQISVAVHYNYWLAEAAVGDPLTTSLPVLLMPRSTYLSTLPQQLADSLTTWQSNNDPSKVGGEWQIAVSLYSAVEPTLDRPVLQLQRIISPLPAGENADHDA